MRTATILALAILTLATLPASAAHAQERGNQGYQRESGNQIYADRNPTGLPLSGDLLLYDPKDLTPAPYVEAYVLMNVKPDAFLAVFAVAQEGPSPAESNRRVDKLVGDLTAALQPLGVRGADLFVDFIAQIPVYDYTVGGRTARESQTGFQTKKTLSVRYADRALLEPMVAAAAQLGVYDLVKVDYVVNDMGAVRQRLFEEAAKVIARKEASQSALLGLALRSKAVAEERYASFAPADLYKTYTAYEAGDASTQRVVDKRKTSTSFYDPLTSASFDAVINPAGVEPVVQATLFLKVRCQWAQ
jgi:uncharacterized protein YggE